MMTTFRSVGFAAATLLAATATTVVCFGEAYSLVPIQVRMPVTDTLPTPGTATSKPFDLLKTASPWLTPVPNGPQALRGKVVVVNFWTYSCINSLRALPYLRTWSERYADKGLVVVGVHAPEFGFENAPDKVHAALNQLGVEYPNLQDNDYTVWRAFKNQGWPGFYFIDANGRMREYRIGEGDYEESEILIRKLLREAGRDLSDIALTPVRSEGVEQQADWSSLASPETYLGSDKATSFASPGGVQKNKSASYTAAPDLVRNKWDLSGTWTIGREYSTLDEGAGTIKIRFHARDAHLVLGGASERRPVRFRVTIDGKAPGLDHGVDVDAQGWGEVTTDRLYQLIRQSGQIGDRTLSVEFSQPGIRAYVFTFG
jgi:thiol-disulfide isomerase/thioredoxin